MGPAGIFSIHSLNPMTTTRLYAPLFIVGVLLSTSLFLLPGGAAAQMSTDSSPTLVEHLRSELTSKDQGRHERALLDVIALANCPATCTLSLHSIQNQTLRIENETGRGAVVDLNTLVPDLLASYRRGPADGHRLLALSALLNIGNEKALEQLLEQGGSQSAHVETTTHRSLVTFYLEKYPELRDRVARKRELSLQDVRRAKAVRVRMAKKQQG